VRSAASTGGPYDHRHVGDANICANIRGARTRTRAHDERAQRRRIGRVDLCLPSLELQTLKAEFFRALAHPVRIRLLEALAAGGEQSVQTLQQRLGIDQPIVSQQLAKLRSNGIVVARKEGTSVSYALADEMLADLLKVARDVLNRRLVGTQSLLRELRRHRA
jgi:ArsR family transcriptional regulator